MADCSACGRTVPFYENGSGTIRCSIGAWEKNLRSTYGIEPMDFAAHVMAQAGRDPVTREELTRPCVDHCEACGQVRGVLNDGTNKTLGHFQHSPNALWGLAADLRRWPVLASGVSINTPGRADAASRYLSAHVRRCPVLSYGEEQ